MRRGWLVVFVLLGLGGCFDKRAFEPPLPDYKLWMKSGASDVSVKKIRLECGATHAADGGSQQESNEIVLVHMCVENAGFQRVDFKGRITKASSQSWCKNWPNLPACQPGAVIPVPSVERRLNSNYCQVRTSYQACLNGYMQRRTQECEALEYPYLVRNADWANQGACLDYWSVKGAERCGSNNYDRPPPECLP